MQATLAGAREVGCEQHTQWLRENRQGIGADYLLALDDIWANPVSDWLWLSV